MRLCIDIVCAFNFHVDFEVAEAEPLPLTRRRRANFIPRLMRHASRLNNANALNAALRNTETYVSLEHTYINIDWLI